MQHVLDVFVSYFLCFYYHFRGIAISKCVRASGVHILHIDIFMALIGIIKFNGFSYVLYFFSVRCCCSVVCWCCRPIYVRICLYMFVRCVCMCFSFIPFIRLSSFIGLCDSRTSAILIHWSVFHRRMGVARIYRFAAKLMGEEKKRLSQFFRVRPFWWYFIIKLLWFLFLLLLSWLNSESECSKTQT